MKRMLVTQDLYLMISKTITTLSRFIHDGLSGELEAQRLARAGYALLTSGCSIKGTFPGDNLSSYLTKAQHEDGGWSDVEETLWCLGYLSASGNRNRVQLDSGMKWLAAVRLPCGAWGKSERDQPRIPLTALTSVLVPEIVDSSALKWLANQWEADLASPTQLTYKGAFYLLAQAHSQTSHDNDLVNRTIAYLNGEQEEDGGFSPWKGHPVGSDPWSTGVVLWGLSRFAARISTDTVERAVSWLESRQLPDGLWPYHYLDDGAAMALIGISNVLPTLSKE